MKVTFSRRGALIASLALLASPYAVSQPASNFPDRPIRVVVPFAAGAGMDIIARRIGQHAQAIFGQPFVIENRPGASTVIGADAVAKAAPDGYTILLTNATTHHQNPFLMKSLPYDALKDFVPVSQVVGNAGIVLVANPEAPAKNVQELMAWVKSKPGAVSYGSIGDGTSFHIFGELLNKKFGTDMTHVPYKAASSMDVDLISNRVQLSYMGPQNAGPYAAAGKIRLLAVTGTERMPSLPDVPTFKEQGIDGFEAVATLGFYAPANTPPAIVDKLGNGIARIMAMDEVKKAFAAMGNFPISTTPQQAKAMFETDHKLWQKVIETTGIKLN